MKKFWLLTALLIGSLLLTGCNKTIESSEIIDDWNIVNENIELSGYSSNLTYDSPFVPWDIPDNFSWNIIEIDNYWITTKFDEIGNKEDVFEVGAVTPYYFPGLIKDICDPADEHEAVNHKVSLFDLKLY